jgi:hypothetical protein
MMGMAEKDCLFSYGTVVLAGGLARGIDRSLLCFITVAEKKLRW